MQIILDQHPLKPNAHLTNHPDFILTGDDELHSNLNFLEEVETGKITALAIRLTTNHRTALEMN